MSKPVKYAVVFEELLGKLLDDDHLTPSRPCASELRPFVLHVLPSSAAGFGTRWSGLASDLMRWPGGVYDVKPTSCT